jgi:hypothetical protein
MEITDVTKQTHELAAIIRQAIAERGWSYENMTFQAALVVERATGLIASEARGWAWQNDSSDYDRARRTVDHRSLKDVG